MAKSPTSAGETKEDFQKQMTDTLLAGFKMYGISLGIKLNLFEAFDMDGGQLSSSELAARVQCKERYVREWLHHMVMCDVIDVDASGKRFSLPEHRRAVLSDGGHVVTVLGPAFTALVAPHYKLLECFKQDGPIGLPFDDVLPFFDERTLKNTPGLQFCANHIRDNIPGIRDKLDSGITVLELGCGNGALLLHLAEQFPRSSFVGIDLSEQLLDKAKASLAAASLANVELLLQDATEAPDAWRARFDLVIIRDVLHDISHASKALSSVHGVLKVDGKLGLYEVNLSRNPRDSLVDPVQKTVGTMAYIISCYHCLPASLIVPGSQGLGAGPGLETIRDLLEDAGFSLDSDPSPADLFNRFFICSKKA